MLPFPLFDGPEHQPFRLAGGPRTALLVHGFPGTPAEMRPLAQHLHQCGWTVQALLLPGFGPFLPHLADFGLGAWREAICAAAQGLRQAGQPFVLLGYSLGGALALTAAPDLRPDGLILLSPFTGFPGPLWGLLPLLRRIGPPLRPFRRLRGDVSDPHLRDGLAAFLPGVDLDDPAVQAGLRNFVLPWRLLDELRRTGRAALQAGPQVTAPALLLQGNADPVVRPARTRRLAAAYGGRLTCHEVAAGHELLDPNGAAWPHILAAVDFFLEQNIA